MLANKRGSVFYIIVGIIAITFILGISLLYHLGEEYHAVNFSQASELCLNIAESAANEAFYYVQKKINDHWDKNNLNIYEYFRFPLVSDKNVPTLDVPVPKTEVIASALGGKVNRVYAIFWKRRLFDKNFWRQKIEATSLDPRETIGTFSIVVDVSYRYFRFTLRVDREMKVVRTTPPRPDFSLWVKNASADTFNVWKSYGGWTPAQLLVLNGSDPDPLYHAAIYLGNGKEIPSSLLEQVEKIHFTKDPNITSVREKSEYIVLNLTDGMVEDPLFSLISAQVIRTFLSNNKKRLNNFTSSEVFRNRNDFFSAGFPHNEMGVHESTDNRGGMTVEVAPGIRKYIIYQKIGHDYSLLGTNPFNIPGFNIPLSDIHPGFKYFINKLYDIYQSDYTFFNKYWVDLTKSGLDLAGIDYWFDKTEPSWPRTIYGYVYKSYVKLNLMRLASPSDPDNSTGGYLWGILPWTPPNFSILDLPVNYFVGSTNSADIPPDAFFQSPVSGKTFREYGITSMDQYNKIKSKVVYEPYNIDWATRKPRLAILYDNPWTAIAENESVDEWSFPKYVPPEFSWDKISERYDSFEQFATKYGFVNKDGKFYSLADQLRGLAGKGPQGMDLKIYPIVDFGGNFQKFVEIDISEGNIRLPSNLRYLGKAWLCFVPLGGGSKVMLDGIYKFTTLELDGKLPPDSPLKRKEQLLTIALLDYWGGSTISLTNKTVECSLFAPNSTIELNMDGTDKRWCDVFGDTTWDIDVLGNVVVKELNLKKNLFNNGLSGKKFRIGSEEVETGGGVIRWDEAYRLETDKVVGTSIGGFANKYYGVSVSKKITYWKLQTNTVE